MPALAHRLLRVLAAAGLLLVATSGPARAAVIYNQPADFPPNNFNFLTTATGAGSAGFRTYDSFVLSESSTITGFSWQGLYYDFINPVNNPVNPNTTTWQLGIFASDPVTGLPAAAPLSTHTLPAAAVTTTFVADAVIFDPVNSPVRILSFHANLPASFQAQAGVRYWFSPFSVQPTFNPIFGWTSGTGGDGLSVQDNLTTGVRNATAGRDRAFSVEGAAVPAPPAFVLLLAGGATLGLRQWARRPRPDVT
jgi:hypothetical protein